MGSLVRQLSADTRGAAMMEYLAATAVVGLVLAAAMVARGDMLLFDYANARGLVLLPAM